MGSGGKLWAHSVACLVCDSDNYSRYSPMFSRCSVLLSVLCESSPRGVSDNTVSRLATIVMVTRLRGEPSQKAPLPWGKQFYGFSEVLIRGGSDTHTSARTPRFAIGRLVAGDGVLSIVSAFSSLADCLNHPCTLNNNLAEIFSLPLHL